MTGLFSPGGPAPGSGAPVRVKICGVTRLEDALAASRAGADALGFNFWPRSRRCVDVEVARGIVRELPAHVVAVGVFVDQDPADVASIAERVGLAAVQLHGDESPDACAAFRLPVIKAFRVGPDFTPASAARFKVAAYLFDAPSAGYGGSGATFDWSRVARAPLPAPLILAGGLTPGNVAAAVRAVRPHAVDVASGVESAPGIKDEQLMIAFVAAAQSALGGGGGRARA